MTKIIKTLEIGKFERDGAFTSIDHDWEENSFVTIAYDKKSRYIEIIANKNGFISLAKLFLSFAEDDIPIDGWHLHLDAEPGDLNEGSDDVVIIKTEKNGF